MGFETHLLYSCVVLLLAVKCYGLPMKEQNHAKQLKLLFEGFEHLSSSLRKREIEQELVSQELIGVDGIGSNVQAQKSLDTLWQEAEPIDQNTLNFIFKNVNQSEVGSYNKTNNLSNTYNNVNTKRKNGKNNKNTLGREEITASDQSYTTSRQEIMLSRNNTLNESYSIQQEELDLLVKRVFGRPNIDFGLNNNSLINREDELNKTNVSSNFLKEVFGKNWDKENRPINEENLNTIYENGVISGSRYPTDESNSHSENKTVQQFFHEVFGNNWDIENKPISKNNLEFSLNLFRPNSKQEKNFNGAVEDEQSGKDQETSLFENQYNKPDWGRDYELPDLRPYRKDIWPYRSGSAYPPWTRHSIHNAVEHDKVDYFGNGIESQLLHENGIKTDSSTCDDEHDDRELLINYNTRPEQNHYFHPDKK